LRQPSRQADGGHQHAVPAVPAGSFQAAASNGHGVVDALAGAPTGQRAEFPRGLLLRAACICSPDRERGNPAVDARPGSRLDSRHPRRKQVEAWRQVTRAAHQADGLIFNQLWHAGRISRPALQPDHMLPVYRRPSDLLKLAAPSSSARCSSTDISGWKIRSTPSRPTTLGSERVTRNLSL